MNKNNNKTLIAFSIGAALLLGVAALPIQNAYSQSSQWTWSTPVHTTCDGFTLPTVKHSANTIAALMSAPFIKVNYPDPDGTVFVDHPGNGGCVYVSYVNHAPHKHDFTGDPASSYVHAIWFVGGCSDFVLRDGCYKYEQRNYFYNSGTSADPRFRHTYQIFGKGFASSLGYPLYNVFFRIDTDVLGAAGDSFQRKTTSGTWETASTETNYQATTTGTVFRVRDSSSTTKYLDISVPTVDGFPKVWVLKYVSGQTDPTGNVNSGKLNEPGIWDNNESVNGADIVYWYKNHVQSSSTQCSPIAPCIVGPTVYLRGGL